jgi:hypothetical protein
METKGKITKKYESGKAVKIGNDIYSFDVSTNVKDEIKGYNEGDEVSVEYSKKGTMKLISKISRIGSPSTQKSATSTPKQTTPEPGKPEPVKPESTKPPYDPKDRSFYGSPEDIKGKEIGCCLAAASAAAGRGFIDDKGNEDPIMAAEWIKIVAGELLKWLKE